MTEPIKLKVAGDKHTMDVARCRQLPFGNDPEIEYEGRDGTKVWVPKPSSDRQLLRLNLTMETVVGRRITIKRDANSTKGRPAFWGIYLEDGNGNGDGGKARVASAPAASLAQPSGSSPAPSAQPAPAAKEKEKELHGYALYRAITEKVLADLVGLYVDAGVPIDSQTVAVISATIFIQAERR